MKVHLLRLYLAIFFGVLLVRGLFGQDVFPVSVSGGILIRPNSMVLSDYATDRAQDVMFTLLLRDPVELSRDVTLRLTIRNENNEILITDPNFNFGPIITLERNIPLLIDGIDLAPYLNPNSLVGQNGQFAGGLLPEGFNEFCLEVIDVQRNIPISASGCAGGYFEQSDPPILISPNCGQSLTWSETPNLLFNWNLAFLSPNNPPFNVQYEFEIARVEEGQNPNESFIFAPHYSEVVSSPTFLFLEGEPALVPNQLYAWRVRAFDDSGADMFRNNGDSQICTFLFTDYNDENSNPLNFTCDDGSCNWIGDLSSSLPIDGSLDQNEQVSIGHFDMELIDSQTSDGISYSGEGTIYVPFLKSKVNVRFTNIKINSSKRVYFGEVEAVASTESNLIPSFFAANNSFDIGNAIGDVAGNFPDASADALQQYFTSPEGSAKLTSALNSGTASNAPELDLPIGLDQPTDGILDPLALGITNSTDPLVIALTGLTFTANNARLNAVLATRTDDGEDWVKFGTKNLCFQPAGLTREDGVKMDLLGSPTVQQDDLAVSLIGLNNDGEDGSYLNWTCTGFEQFSLFPGDSDENQDLDLEIDCGNDLEAIVFSDEEKIDRFEGDMTLNSLQIGYFRLIPNYPLASDDGNGNIRGTGTIEVPALGPFRKLNVDFSDNPIGVDPSGRIVMGRVTTSGTTIDVSPLETEAERIIRLEAIAQNVENQLATASSVGPDSFFDLPVVLGVSADGANERDQGLILTGLVFEPEKAFAEAKVVFDTGDEKYIEFKASGLEIAPNGIAGINLTVGLAEAFPFQPFDELNPLTFQPYNEVDNSGSFVKCDCSGFLEFQLEGSYTFDEDDIIPLDGQRTAVEATVTINSTAWGDFIGELSGLGSFSFPGLEDFPMTASSAYLDFSKTRNVADEDNGIEMEFAIDYYDPDLDEEMLEWQGFFLPLFSVGLPPDLMVLSAQDRPSTLVCENLMIDKQGVSFSLYGENLVDTRLGNWAFGLDSLGIGILMNSFTGAGVEGTFDMPLLDGALEYGGNLQKDENGFWEFNLFPLNTTRLGISALSAFIELSPSSVITMGKVLNPETGIYKYQPYADLYGKIALEITEEDFNAQPGLADLIGVVEGMIGQKFEFSPPELSIYGLKINHPDLDAGRKFGLDAVDLTGSIAFGDIELAIEGMELVEEAEVIIAEGTFGGVGLQFHLSVVGVNFDLEIWAKEDQEGNFSFWKYDIKLNLPALSCEAPAPEDMNGFEIGEGMTEIVVPFLNNGSFIINQIGETGNYRTANLEISLRETLEEMGSSLPVFEGASSEDLGLSGLGDTDFIITGIVFFPDGTATLNADLVLDIDGVTTTFTGSLPIYQDGILFNEIKIGLANDIGF
jgi:hypothetical protein